MLSDGYASLRFIIVDDVPHVRKLLRGVLINLGIRRIIECANRDEAFEAVRFTQPDIVITDWDMPGGSGLDLIRAIRRDPRSLDPTLPIILLTAHGGRDQVEQGRNEGATDFLIKPFTPASIAARIRDVVGRQRPTVVTPTYLGPDRRRANRPVAGERRASSPHQDIRILPADGLLLAKVMGDHAGEAIAKERRAEAAAIVHAAGGGGRRPPRQHRRCVAGQAGSARRCPADRPGVGAISRLARRRAAGDRPAFKPVA